MSVPWTNGESTASQRVGTRAASVSRSAMMLRYAQTAAATVTTACVTMSVSIARTDSRVVYTTSHGKISVGIRFTSSAAASPRTATAASFARLITVGLTGSGSRIDASRRSTTSESHCATASSALTVIDSAM